MFVERNTQYASFSSKKQAANTGSERKQFTENGSVALQQTILTHEHTKCPPVVLAQIEVEIKKAGIMIMITSTLFMLQK